MNPEELRKRAEAYRKLAGEAKRSEEQELMLSIAESWDKMAELLDKSRTEPSPEGAEGTSAGNDREADNSRER